MESNQLSTQEISVNPCLRATFLTGPSGALKANELVELVLWELTADKEGQCDSQLLTGEVENVVNVESVVKWTS